MLSDGKVDPVEVIRELGTQIRESILAGKAPRNQPYVAPWTSGGAVAALGIIAALSVGYIVYDKFVKR